MGRSCHAGQDMPGPANSVAAEARADEGRDLLDNAGGWNAVVCLRPTEPVSSDLAKPPAT